MNRKGAFGITGEEVLKIILVAVIVVLLAFAGWKMIGFFRISEVDKAISVLDELEGKIEAVEEGSESILTVQSPCEENEDCEWYIQGWGRDDVGRPDRCFFESCICICEGLGASACQNEQNGVCREVGFDEVEVKGISKVSRNLNPTKGISGGNSIASDEVCKNIFLRDSLIEVSVSKEVEKLTLTSETSSEVDKEDCAGV